MLSKHRQDAAIAVLAVIALVGTIFTPSGGIASSVAALPAGDTQPDWYKCKQVPVLRTDGAVASKVANLRVCNWDDPNGPGQIYLVDMDGDTSLSPDLTTYRLYVDNRCVCSTDNVTIRYTDPRSVHDFRGQWLRGVFSQYAEIDNF